MVADVEKWTKKEIEAFLRYAKNERLFLNVAQTNLA